MATNQFAIGNQMKPEIHNFGKLSQSIFQEVPDEITEDWTWGVLVGGMAAERDTASIARAHKRTGDILIKEALEGGLAWEFTYPILFNYRHALELYLKAVLQSKYHGHDLSSLVSQLDDRSKLPRSAVERLREFANFDPQSTNFRYADVKESNPLLGTETWVDLRQLSETVNLLSQALEALLA